MELATFDYHGRLLTAAEIKLMEYFDEKERERKKAENDRRIEQQELFKNQYLLNSVPERIKQLGHATTANANSKADTQLVAEPLKDVPTAAAYDSDAESEETGTPPAAPEYDRDTSRASIIVTKFNKADSIATPGLDAASAASVARNRIDSDAQTKRKEPEPATAIATTTTIATTTSMPSTDSLLVSPIPRDEVSALDSMILKKKVRTEETVEDITDSTIGSEAEKENVLPIIFEGTERFTRANHPKIILLPNYGPNNSVVLSLLVPSGGESFFVNMCPEDTRDNCNILLHLNPRVGGKKRELVMNDMQGTWGTNDFQRLPDVLAAGSVDLEVQIRQEGFLILLNGNVYFYFQHRRDISYYRNKNLSVVLGVSNNCTEAKALTLQKVSWGYKEPFSHRFISSSAIERFDYFTDRSVYVFGLPINLSATDEYEWEKAVYAAFESYGVESVFLVPGKGCGYARLEHEDAVATLIDELNGMQLEHISIVATCTIEVVDWR